MSKTRYSLGPLVATIKQELKVRSLTYLDVAKALGTTEASIKQRFSRLQLSFEHIGAIAELLGFSLSELFEKMEQSMIWQLSNSFELAMLSDSKLFLVYTHIMDDWTVDDIVTMYDITHAECIKHLRKLQELRVIELLPDNRIRKLKPRIPKLIRGGPLYNNLRSATPDFFDDPFEEETANIDICRGMYSLAAIKQIQGEMDNLKKRLADLHEESLLTPFENRRHIILIMAEREWLPQDFANMRRKKPEKG